MSTNLEKIEALLPDFQYVDSDNDRVVMTVGFTATFYFWAGHTAAKRNAVVECIEAFESAYGEHLRWGMDEDAGRRVNLTDNKLPPLRQYAKSLMRMTASVGIWHQGRIPRLSPTMPSRASQNAGGWMARCRCFAFKCLGH